MCELYPILILINHFQPRLPDSCFGMDSRAYAIEVLTWESLLFRAVGLMILFVLVRAVWRRFTAAAKSSSP